MCLQVMLSSGDTVVTVTPDDGITSRQFYYILSTTPVFYFVIPPSVAPIPIVIMYHLMSSPESFEISEKRWTHPLRGVAAKQ
jgi:hypothetical protein